jgi:hypothetical protein
LNLFKKKRLWLEILSPLIKHLVKFQNWVDHLLEAVILIILDHKQDMFNAQKVNFKRERKSFIPLLFTKLMLLTQELKVSWHFLPEILVKSSLKSENKSTKKSPNGEKKEELKSFQVSSSLMRCICWILNVTHS